MFGDGQRRTSSAVSAEVGDVGEGVAGEADPDGFGDAVDLDERDAGEPVRDPVAAGAAVPGAVAEHQADVFGFGHPESDPDRQQVALREDVFAGVLDGADDEDAGGAGPGTAAGRGPLRSAASRSGR